MQMKISTNCSPLVIYFGFFFPDKTITPEKFWGRRAPSSGCGVEVCRMVSGTGSSLIPGPGEKAGTEGYIFSVGVGC